MGERSWERLVPSPIVGCICQVLSQVFMSSSLWTDPDRSGFQSLNGSRSLLILHLKLYSCSMNWFWNIQSENTVSVDGTVYRVIRSKIPPISHRVLLYPIHFFSLAFFQVQTLSSTPLSTSVSKHRPRKRPKVLSIARRYSFIDCIVFGNTGALNAITVWRQVESANLWTKTKFWCAQYITGYCG